MIQNKSFPDDPKRRWVIAKLLQIPPALLGVKALDDLLPDLQVQAVQEPQKVTPVNKSVTNMDLKAYRQALKDLSNLNHAGTAVTAWNNILQNITNLEHMTLYNESDKKQRIYLISLLCGYHMLVSYIARDQQWYDVAIAHCNQAYGLARNEQLPDMQAAILQQRGCVLYSQACNYDNQPPAHQCFVQALSDFQKALTLEKSLIPYPGLQGYLHIASGVVQAHIATHPFQLHEALKEVDKAEKFVGDNKSFDIIHQCPAFSIDESRYHLDRASVYINAPIRAAQYPRDSRKELYWAKATGTLKAKRRQTLSTIFLARSYLVEQAYEEAIKAAEEALVEATAIRSSINITRIASICRELQATDFGKSHLEVPALEIEVAKALHPRLFL